MLVFKLKKNSKPKKNKSKEKKNQKSDSLVCMSMKK